MLPFLDFMIPNFCYKVCETYKALSAIRIPDVHCWSSLKSVNISLFSYGYEKMRKTRSRSYKFTKGEFAMDSACDSVDL